MGVYPNESMGVEEEDEDEKKEREQKPKIEIDDRSTKCTHTRTKNVREQRNNAIDNLNDDVSLVLFSY